MVMKTQVVAFCFKLHPKNGGSKPLRNGGILPYHYTAS